MLLYGNGTKLAGGAPVGELVFSAFEIQEGRISKNRTLTKDEVLAPLRDVLTSIARDEIEKFFRKMNIHVED
jgi:hypothetical protein